MRYDEGHDIWCLGGVFYEMMMGRAPFDFGECSDHKVRTMISALGFPRRSCSYKVSCMKTLRSSFPDITQDDIISQTRLSISLQAENVINNLLCSEFERLSIEDLKAHEFFVVTF